MYYYIEEERRDGEILYCAEKDLSRMGLKRMEGIPAGKKWKSLCFLFEREPHSCRSAFALSRNSEIAALQMAQKEEGVYWLNRRALEAMGEESPGIEAFIGEPEILKLKMCIRDRAITEAVESADGKAIHIMPPRK